MLSLSRSFSPSTVSGKFHRACCRRRRRRRRRRRPQSPSLPRPLCHYTFASTFASTFTSADTGSPAFPTVHDSPRVSNFPPSFQCPISSSFADSLRTYSFSTFSTNSTRYVITGDSDGRLIYIIISSFPPRNLRLFNFVYFSHLNLFHT